jgi:hypothetical protein
MLKNLLPIFFLPLILITISSCKEEVPEEIAAVVGTWTLDETETVIEASYFEDLETSFYNKLFPVGMELQLTGKKEYSISYPDSARSLALRGNFTVKNSGSKLVLDPNSEYEVTLSILGNVDNTMRLEYSETDDSEDLNSDGSVDTKVGYHNMVLSK